MIKITHTDNTVGYVCKREISSMFWDVSTKNTRIRMTNGDTIYVNEPPEFLLILNGEG